MRLTPHEIAAIKAAARLTFGSDSTVRLFGSRIYDGRRGGDIDLHIEHARDVHEWDAKDEFLERLFARIDEQRIDFLISRRGASPTAIEQIAYRDGIVL